MNPTPDQKVIDELAAPPNKGREEKAPRTGAAALQTPDASRVMDLIKKDPERREIFDGGIGKYASSSEADASMFFNLAFFCRKDTALMEEVALRSGRVRPKWNERRSGTTWLREELRKAANKVSDTYDGEHQDAKLFLTADSNDSDFQDLQNQDLLLDLPDPEEFPVEALPPGMQQLVREGAASIGCPVDYLGAAVLAAQSAAIGDTRRIVLKKGWTEGAAIFAAIVGGPASKKTPAMNAALKPIRERQLTLKTEYERQKEEYAAELREYEKISKDGPVEYSRPEKPTLGRTYVDDTTVERLADILKENPRGVIVARDELSGWLGSMNQYKQGGKGSDRQFWLSVHTNQPIVVDRKTSEEPVIVPHPFASIIGGIQPEVLPDFGKARGDGLIDRFIFAYPAAQVGKWTDDEIADSTLEAYTKTIERLYRYEHSRDDEGKPYSLKVSMTEEAKKLFVGEYNKLHQELENPGFPQRLRPVWGKLEAYLARFALILAMYRIAELSERGEQVYEEVSYEDMAGAVRLLNYFKNHARRVYTGLYGDSPTDKLAADIRRFLLPQSGKWEGITSELYEALDSDYKPERPEDLAKAVRAIAKRSPLLELTDLKRTEKRRPFRLTLRNAVSAVSAVSAVMPSAGDDYG